MTRFSRTITSLLFFAGCALLTPAAQAADWEGVFEGRLGKSKIIVQLVQTLDDLEGDTRREASRYSYLPGVRDINLMLSSQEKELGFEETPLQPYAFKDAAEVDKKLTGRWTLRVTGDTGAGTWTSPDGKKTLPIELSRVADISAEQAGPDRNIQIATYDDLWAKTVRFADAGSAKSFGSVEIRMVKDSAFGASFPILGKFPDAARMAKANAVLLAAHLRAVVQYRECKNGVPVAWEEADGEPEFSHDVTYGSPTVLSFNESGSVFCGGAHPSNYVKPVTYDLLAATQMGGSYLLDLSPLGFGRVLKLANKDERIAFERFALARWKVAADREKDAELASACSTGWIDESPEGEREFDLSFVPTGLAVTRVDFPHAASVCLSTDFNPTIIPWADLKPWLKPGQKLLTTEIQ